MKKLPLDHGRFFLSERRGRTGGRQAEEDGAFELAHRGASTENGRPLFSLGAASEFFLVALGGLLPDDLLGELLGLGGVSERLGRAAALGPDLAVVGDHL